MSSSYAWYTKATLCDEVGPVRVEQPGATEADEMGARRHDHPVRAAQQSREAGHDPESAVLSEPESFSFKLWVSSSLRDRLSSDKLQLLAYLVTEEINNADIKNNIGN